MFQNIHILKYLDPDSIGKKGDTVWQFKRNRLP